MKTKSKKNSKNKKSKKNVRKNKRSRKNIGKYSRKNVLRGGGGGKLLTNKVIEYIINRVSTDPTLTILNIDNISSKGATALAGSLKDNTTLTTLYIGDNISYDGIITLTQILNTMTALETLYIINNNISAIGVEALATALKTMSALTTLNISGNYIYSGVYDLAKALENNATLIKLNMSNSQIGPIGAKALALALKKNTTLTTLDIGYNHIGPTGATNLAIALATNKKSALTTLDISNNNIGDDGATALATALEFNKTLKILDISYNQIGDIGAIALADALKTNTTLTTLEISNNNISLPISTSIAVLIHRNIQSKKSILSERLNISQSLDNLFYSFIDQGNKLYSTYTAGNQSMINSSKKNALNLAPVKTFIDSLQMTKQIKDALIKMGESQDPKAINIKQALVFNIPYYMFLKQHEEVDNYETIKSNLLKEYGNYIRRRMAPKLQINSRKTNTSSVSTTSSIRGVQGQTTGHISTSNDTTLGFVQSSSDSLSKELPQLPQEMWDMILEFLDLQTAQALLTSFTS